MMAEKMFIDANVPMYAFGKEHRYKVPCRLIFHKIGIGEILGITSVEVLQEILHRYISIGRTKDGIEIIKRFAKVVEVLPVNVTDVEKATDIAARFTAAK